jgi:hypothetical protein
MVPPASDPNLYKNVSVVDIVNEKGIVAGKFGWCVMSR